MEQQRFTMRWDHHFETLTSNFQSLRNDKSLADVTLAAGGRSFTAHKLVLASSSAYLKQLLSMNPSKHPVIILQDIPFNHLELLVDYMYCGEIALPHDQITAVLKSAEILKIKGLFNDREQK